MENVSKYKLIHIDTLEVTICEKYTFGGHDYYMKGNYQFRGGAAEHLYHIMLNAVATTNPNTGCPQVVDYVDELANEYLTIRCFKDFNTLEEEKLIKKGFTDGYYNHSETHSLSDEEVLQLIQSLKDYTHEANKILGHDEREPSELLEIFKQTLPTKVYYR